ncbi:IclR family transcriptional regulator [Natrarchaeobius chitinivorans]|uniref:IclR family transcriptional regulator n=1 Tax=Natrarchaeobius chitinivorans TaxID=1679083 RepID=A0A3N6M053_NATCH|nr:IclR family transcriptional regulator [Natrarchaeobius chitinivorans]RQG94917.1 IclR family transcriptional regulator [Natrarchaeobius chitinivorans]
MITNTMSKNGIKSATKAFEIIEQIAELDGATVTELATHVDLAKSTVHGYLVSMEEAGYLVKENGEYDLSLQFLEHGTYKRQQYMPSEVVRGPLKHLAESTAEIAWYSVAEHGLSVDIYKSEGEHAISVESWLGQPRPMHALASGKILLAHMPDERIDEIVQMHGLEARTPNTITTRERLDSELEKVRTEGVAFNDEEYRKRIRSVGVPVVYQGTVIGALTVSGPAKRIRGDTFTEELPDEILATANEIELRLQRFW